MSGAVEPGIYRHFKGRYYYVEGVAIHTETKEQLVVYRNEGGEVYCRPLEMWNEHIERFSYQGPRFERVDRFRNE